MILPFTFSSLRNFHKVSDKNYIEVIDEAYRRIEQDDRKGIWISFRDRDDAVKIAKSITHTDRKALPLAGIPFSVKDNIDVAGLVTTAACPKYSYTPEISSAVVARLERAGAICIGKTNLDQFATGLNGTRSPYGACGSAFDEEKVSGGSSSGSAVSVALNQVAFSIGTDTGGSGRIPAGLNNIVGLKPTLGTLSSRGLVPCCPSIDCPSIFALCVNDAVELAGYSSSDDKSDPSLRDDNYRAEFKVSELGKKHRVFVPPSSQREFFGNFEGLFLYEKALSDLKELGAELCEIDMEPLWEAGEMLFDGPWVAERLSSIGDFVKVNKSNVLETTSSILNAANNWSAVSVFKAMKRIKEIKVDIRKKLGETGMLVVPTVAPLYSIAEMRADPIRLNNHHGHYSYFANILDLCAFSVPTGFHSCGMPFGITIMGNAFTDSIIAGLAQKISEKLSLPPGRARTP